MAERVILEVPPMAAFQIADYECRIPGHSVFFDVMDHSYCYTSCIYYMNDAIGVCQNNWRENARQNQLEVRAIFRGSKAQYSTEICTFRRDSETRDQRMRLLNNLLLIAETLPHQLNTESSRRGDNSWAEQNDTIQKTVVILALIQHYHQVLNDTLHGRYVTTPAVDCTWDLHLAASFAMGDHRMENNQGTVRLLVLPTLHPTNYGAAIDRLGETRMLLICLSDLVPFFAWRPINQTSCCLLIQEDDLLDFHELRIHPVRLGQNVVNDVEEWHPNLDHNDDMITAIDSLVNVNEGNRHWDALHWNQFNVRIHGDFRENRENLYFHDLPEERERDVQLHPFLTDADLYPEDDPMIEIMTNVALNAGGEVVG